MIGLNWVFEYTDGYVSTIPTNVEIDFINIGNIEENGFFFGAYAINVGTRPLALASSTVRFPLLRLAGLHAREYNLFSALSCYF